MGSRFRTRLLVAVGHVNRRTPPDLLRACGIAVKALCGLAVIVEKPRHRGDRAVGLQIQVFARGMRRPFDRLAGPRGRRPDRRMRLLVRSRPHVHVFEMVNLALEGASSGPRSCLHDEMVRYTESRMRAGWI